MDDRDTAASQAIDDMPADAAGESAQPLHHTLPHVLRTLRTRRQGMSTISLEGPLHMQRKSIQKLLRRLRAFGAIEPVPSAFGDDEPHWAITAHGVWMLESGTAVTAAYRPADAAPDIVPCRQFVNAAIRETYRPPADAAPMRPGADRAARLPSIMLGRVVMPAAHA